MKHDFGRRVADQLSLNLENKLQEKNKMSKQNPITIEIEEIINVEPKDIYKAIVVKSGNGAVVKAFKRFYREGGNSNCGRQN